jgi:hypothetical protein
MRRIAHRLSLLALSAVLIWSACGCGAAHRPDDPGPRGTLRFKIEPGEALVEVDEVRLGPASMFEQQGLLLKPGEHRVTLKLEHHFTEYRIVEIVEGEVLLLEATLRPVPE